MMNSRHHTMFILELLYISINISEFTKIEKVYGEVIFVVNLIIINHM